MEIFTHNIRDLPFENKLYCIKHWREKIIIINLLLAYEALRYLLISIPKTFAVSFIQILGNNLL